MLHGIRTAATTAVIGVAVTFGGAILVSQPSHAGGNVYALTWEGYANDSWVSVFEAETGCKLTQTYIGSNDEIVAKMAVESSSYDVVSPEVSYAQILISMDVLEPLDPARLDTFNDIFESSRNHPGVQQGGTIYTVPMAWGSIPIMYRTDKFDEPPTSATVLWDPNYAGKIAIQDVTMSLYLAARILFGRDTDVYNLSDEQLEQVKQKYIDQKPLVRDYWSSAGELVDLYAKGEVWVSETWGGYQVALLQEQGIPVAEVIPIEKADGWQDVWGIVKGSANLDCAYAWVNFETSATAQCGMVHEVGYSPANPVAVADCLTAEDREFHHLDDSAYTQGLDFWQLPTRNDVYVDTWNAVKGAQ